MAGNMFDCHIWAKVENSDRHFWEEVDENAPEIESEREHYISIERRISNIWRESGLPPEHLALSYLDGVMFISSNFVKNHPGPAPVSVIDLFKMIAKYYPKSYGCAMMHSSDDWNSRGVYKEVKLINGAISERAVPFV